MKASLGFLSLTELQVYVLYSVFDHNQSLFSLVTSETFIDSSAYQSFHI